MTTTDLAARYLAELEQQLAGADEGYRAEVVGAVRQHIAEAVAELGHEPSSGDMAQILTRLGEPADLVEPVRDEPMRAAPAGGAARPWTQTWVPPAALGLTTVGALGAVGLLPMPLLMAGMFLLVVSPLWTRGEKLLGAVVVPVCLGVLLPSLAMPFPRGTGLPPGLATVLAIGAPLVGLVLVGLLYRRGSRRAQGQSLT